MSSPRPGSPGDDGASVGIEYQTVLGYPPPDFVRLAAELGCDRISMKPSTGNHVPYDPYGFGTFNFVEDLDLRRWMASALADSGVSISLAEGFVVTPGVDLTADPTDLDVMWELGARRANVVTVDTDVARSFDQFAAFAEQAAERGMVTTLEYSSSLAVGDLPTALAAVRHVGRPEFGLLMDTMHVVRGWRERRRPRRPGPGGVRLRAVVRPHAAAACRAVPGRVQ